MARKGDYYPLNDYSIKGDYAALHFINKKREELEILVDMAVLDYLIKINHHWRATYRKKTDSYYAQTILHNQKLIEQYKTRTPYLHKIVLEADASQNQYVHHKNHNTLDNRISNLEVTTNENNSKDRNGQNKNNTSGYRNVCWNKNVEMWMVQLQIDGENTRLGYFDDVHEAGKFAERMRKKYYGKYAGKNRV
ncbi:HNH endonuclease [Paenibacillus pini]|uniref:Endonuclease n=1 Tax=Paenibacillus pini JCM 16418 TaxID=1236976 RepID=W7Z8T8_9BACL|nr:HNH endonuclease [Paenibacillus pini]GAF10879.1 endonuclease [Paenibacillus pini JCM 16418]